MLWNPIILHWKHLQSIFSQFMQKLKCEMWFCSNNIGLSFKFKRKFLIQLSSKTDHHSTKNFERQNFLPIFFLMVPQYAKTQICILWQHLVSWVVLGVLLHVFIINQAKTHKYTWKQAELWWYKPKLRISWTYVAEWTHGREHALWI